MASLLTSETEDPEPATCSENTRDEAQSSMDSDEHAEPAAEARCCSDVAAQVSGAQIVFSNTLPDSYPGQPWMDDSATEADSVYDLQHVMHPKMYDRYSSISGSVSSLRQRQHNVYIVFDMRNNSVSFVRGHEMLLPLDTVSAASKLQVQKEPIYASSTKLKGFRMLVIASSKGEKYYIIKTDLDVYCMRLLSNTKIVKVWETVRTIFEEEKKKSPAASSRKGDEELYLFSEHRRVEEGELLGLSNLAVIKVVHVRPFTWRVVYRWELYCDKCYIVKCRNVDSLVEAKRKFLDLYCTVEKTTTERSLDEIWFTSGDKVLTEKDLHEKCGINVFQRVFRAQHMEYQLRNTAIRATPVAASMEVFVHFQAADAVLVQVECKPGTSKPFNEELVLVISPQISPQQLRMEVAKLVKQDLNSIRIYVGKKKSDSKTDLSKALKGRQCIITVEQKPKLTLTVRVTFKPQCNTSKEFQLEIYSYDTVGKVKDDVCKKISVSQHKVDLYFDRRLLSDDNTLSQNRLRSKDSVEATVFMNRTLIRVRSPSRRLHSIAVDDCFRSTVSDVKLFVQSLEDPRGLHPQAEVVAIYRDMVLDDRDFLGRIGITPDSARYVLIFVRVENMCFTASSSHKGTLAVLQDSKDGTFQYMLAMSNGERLFYDPVAHTADQVNVLLTERRKVLQQMPGVSGIRVFSKSVRERLAAETTRSEVPGQGVYSAVPTATPAASDTLLTNRPKAESSGERPSGRKSSTTVCGRKVNRPTSVRFHGDDSDTSTCSAFTPDTESPLSPFKKKKTTSTMPKGSCLAVCKSQSVGSFHTANLNSSDRKRSKSCPPLGLKCLSERLQNAEYSDVKSDSENICRKDVSYTKFTRQADGQVTVTHLTKSKISVPANIAAKAMEASRRSPPFTGNLQDTPGAGAVVPYPSHELGLIDPTYKYIKESVILRIAKHLGLDGMMLMRTLGVGQDVIDRAEGLHSRNIVEKYVYCLQAWCRKFGATANAQTLKEALKQCDRNDLVETVDEIDSQSDA